MLRRNTPSYRWPQAILKRVQDNSLFAAHKPITVEGAFGAGSVPHRRGSIRSVSLAAEANNFAENPSTEGIRRIERISTDSACRALLYRNVECGSFYRSARVVG
jgi:hypothetical protein